jgi:hypothetical protein
MLREQQIQIVTSAPALTLTLPLLFFVLDSAAVFCHKQGINFHNNRNMLLRKSNKMCYKRCVLGMG